MGNRKTSRRNTQPAQVFTKETFTGLNIGSDGKHPTTRHKEPTPNPSGKEKRIIKREREQKRLHDMYRQNILQVEQAIRNKRVLNFRMSEFVRARERGAVPMEGGGPFMDLGKEKIELKEEDGATLLVDLDDTIIFWYFPGYIGQGLQSIFLDNLTDLLEVYPPKKDQKKGDRRSNASGDGVSTTVMIESTAASGPMTRSRTCALASSGDGGTIFEQGEEEAGMDDGDSGHWRDELQGEEATDDGDSEFSEYELEEEDERPELLDTYIHTEGEVAWAGSSEETSGVNEQVEEAYDTTKLDAFNSAILPPSSYYLSPAWYQTGMENKRPIATSRQFREALRESSARQMIRFLEGKRLFDSQLKHLIDIIHSSLGRSMRELGKAMLKIRGPTKSVLENGWTSPFPCFGVGINRTTAIHRDSKGLRGGMDVIGVLGDFNGGTFKLQDLNVELGWSAGCLGAFDGYDLTHEVLGWKGVCRLTLLSFCRSSTWRGLKLNPNLSIPTLDQVLKDLTLAKEKREKGIEESKRKHSKIANEARDRAALTKRSRFDY